MTQNDKPNRTVRAGRRRPAGSSDSGERERASAPQRQQPSSSGSQPPSSGSGGGSYSSGGSPRPPMLPGGGRPMSLAGIAIIVVIALCAFVAFSLLGGGDDGGTNVAQQDSQPVATQKPLPTRVPPTPALALGQQNQPANATGGGDTWTVMLYQDADDKILEEDIYIDLNEVERIGSSDKVNIVAQMDRYKGGFSGDGNWTGAAPVLHHAGQRPGTHQFAHSRRPGRGQHVRRPDAGGLRHLGGRQLSCRQVRADPV